MSDLPPPGPPAYIPPATPPKRAMWKRKRVWIPSAVVVVLIVAAIAGGGSKNDKKAATAAPSTTAGSTVTGPTTSAAATTTRPKSTSTRPPTTVATTQAPKPTAPPPAFKGDGTKLVGTDIQPGIYRTRDKISGCYWEREKGTGGSADDVLANDNADGRAIVQVLPSDQALKVERCGSWEVLAPFLGQLQEFGDGTWAVGLEIAPGRYRASGAGCYWARVRDFTGGINAVIANDNNDNPVVTIAPGDKGFVSARCGTWQRA